MKGRTAVTIAEIVEKAWQLSRAGQQRDAERIAASLAAPRSQATPHDTPDPATGALRSVWALAA